MTNGESWHMRGRLKTGTRVYDVHDERHIGRLDAIFASGDHRVTFDNGLCADIPARRIRKAKEGD